MDGVAVEWTWDAASGTLLPLRRTADPHVTMSGARLAAWSVVVLAVPYQPSPVDARSPAAVAGGTSPSASCARDGVAIPVIWSRATSLGIIEYGRAATGKPVPLDVGTTSSSSPARRDGAATGRHPEVTARGERMQGGCCRCT